MQTKASKNQIFWPKILYDYSDNWSNEFTVASLLPLFASATDFITSLSMLGNISWIWN